MLAYRSWGLRERGIKNPNVVCFSTAHVAFDKAAFYFGFEIRKAPIKNCKPNVEDLRSYIDDNTICLIGSCPEYTFGNYDDMQKLGELAEEYGIGLHSDCCLGSFINPFISESGY